MKKFVNYDREREVVVVDPLFQLLQETMELPKHHIDEEKAANFTVKMLNTKYLVKNKPVKIKGYAKDWKAIELWTNKTYL
jgi:hypothetical protein